MSPKLRLPHFDLSNRVAYDYCDVHKPNGEDSRERKSLDQFDFSPLPRVNWASFSMGILVSMGGFM